MNTKEVSNAVAELQQQVIELRRLVEQQALEIEALRMQRAATMQLRPQPSHAEHLDRVKRIDAVARLSAKHPHSKSFSPQQVAAEIAAHEAQHA